MVSHLPSTSEPGTRSNPNPNHQSKPTTRGHHRPQKARDEKHKRGKNDTTGRMNEAYCSECYSLRMSHATEIELAMRALQPGSLQRMTRLTITMVPMSPNWELPERKGETISAVNWYLFGATQAEAVYPSPMFSDLKGPKACLFGLCLDSAKTCSQEKHRCSNKWRINHLFLRSEPGTSYAGPTWA